MISTKGHDTAQQTIIGSRPLPCSVQFEAFTKGFMTLCGGPAIHLFSATELERLVCGNPLLDFDAMQANARYDGGYSPDHRVSLPARVQLLAPSCCLCSWTLPKVLCIPPLTTQIRGSMALSEVSFQPEAWLLVGAGTCTAFDGCL